MFGNKTNCSQRNVASELTGKYTDSGNYVDTAVVKLEESFAIWKNLVEARPRCYYPEIDGATVS